MAQRYPLSSNLLNMLLKPIKIDQKEIQQPSKEGNGSSSRASDPRDYVESELLEKDLDELKKISFKGLAPEEQKKLSEQIKKLNKEHKKAVKAQRQEQLKNKMPKHIKKKKIKKHKAKAKAGK